MIGPASLPPMRSSRWLFAAAFVVSAVWSPPAAPAPDTAPAPAKNDKTGIASAVELPYVEAKLPNGLTVIVHEDHTLPQVATNIIYRVGSKDEQPGRTGFAHLFEHLMFMGTTR